MKTRSLLVSPFPPCAGVVLVLLAAALLSIGGGCGGSGAGGGSASGGAVLIYAQPEDPKTLDPINTDIAEAVHVLTNVFDTLVAYDDETTEIVPALAESWEHSEDGLVWTFRLRPGVKFHDGTPLTSEAVKLSLERLTKETHPLVFDPARPYRSAYAMIDEIETPDETTVVLKLKAPSAILLANLAMFPASIISPMMLLPSTVSPSLLTVSSERKPLAVWANWAAARACKPSRFLISNSRRTAPPLDRLSVIAPCRGGASARGIPCCRELQPAVLPGQRSGAARRCSRALS